MTIKSEYFDLLKHLGPTSTINNLNQNLDSNLIALRHDVDYDLDIALEMAFHEKEFGCKSTYFLLPTASYWNSENFKEKCIQLTQYGHEIGLHVNAVIEFMDNKNSSFKKILQEQLSTLRSFGLEIRGVAAHGDAKCYEYSLSNYWCFSDLKPKQPFEEENGRTAEGPKFEKERRILSYPSLDEIKNPSGDKEYLWSVPFSEINIDYHAWHVRHDLYFSDSGGSWARTGSPMEISLKNKRAQILVHPEYWLGKKKTYFFICPARSGSKYLNKILQTSSNFESNHEYILNQEFHCGKRHTKPTEFIKEIEKDNKYLENSFISAWKEMLHKKRDTAEVNVYLSQFVDHIKKFFPESKIVFLYRDPSLVLRSLEKRGWYDTAFDEKHPTINLYNPENLTQFQRICVYLQQCLSECFEKSDYTLKLDDLTDSIPQIVKSFRDLGIIAHPELLKNIIGNKLDSTSDHDREVFDNWQDTEKQFFIETVPRINQDGFNIPAVMPNNLSEPKPKFGKKYEYNINFSTQKVFLTNAIFRNGVLKKINEELHSTAILFGSTWDKTNFTGGLPVSRNGFYKGTIEVKIYEKPSIENKAISGYLLYYNKGKQIEKKRLFTLDKARPKVNFSFSIPDKFEIDIAIFIPQYANLEIELSNFKLNKISSIPLVYERAFRYFRIMKKLSAPIYYRNTVEAKYKKWKMLFINMKRSLKLH